MAVYNYHPNSVSSFWFWAQPVASILNFNSAIYYINDSSQLCTICRSEKPTFHVFFWVIDENWEMKGTKGRNQRLSSILRDSSSISWNYPSGFIFIWLLGMELISWCYFPTYMSFIIRYFTNDFSQAHSSFLICQSRNSFKELKESNFSIHSLENHFAYLWSIFKKL